MTAVWNGRFAELVKALAGLRESTALELLPDVMPVLNVLEDGQEYAFQRGERYLAANCAGVAGAGNYSKVAITNPAGSNQLVVVRQLGATAGAGAMNLIAYIASDAAALATAANIVTLDGRDGRWNGVTGGASANTPTVVAGGNNATTYVAQCIASRYCAANTQVDLLNNHVVVLPPGWTCGVQGGTLNTALYCNATWEERALSTRDELMVK